MKHFFVILLFSGSSLLAAAQDTMRLKMQPHKGALNTEVFGGYCITIPLGTGANEIRDLIDKNEVMSDDYSGALAPKSTAYVGITVDYQFHKVAALGFGLVYTPRGFWVFEKNPMEGSANLPYVTLAEKRKTFVTVDYFDIPIFYKEYLARNRFSLRFGPVISLAVVSKVRIITEEDGEKTKVKYRLGEDISGNTFNETPRPVVPGFEADFSYGSANGWHGTLGFCFSTTQFDNADFKSFIVRLGVGYTFSN